MALLKTDIIARLQKDILPLQGFKAAVHSTTLELGLGPINNAFPNHCFPLGAIHEFICAKREDLSASAGFIAGILSVLSGRDGVCLWISSSRKIFPPALRSFGIQPERVIFIDLSNEQQILWVMEEALKCNGLSAVVGEMQKISFTASRRLQLAVEQSQVTGFILRCNQQKPDTTACLTRWRITLLPAITEDKMPGVGFPRWKVELLKVRNGKPGAWELEWKAGEFFHTQACEVYNSEEQVKTG